MGRMNKSLLVEQLRRVLEGELEVLLKAAATAKEAATHAEAKPENKYDTRGLEASYLAGAQEGRAAELKRDLQILAALPLRSFAEGDKVSVTAVVTVDRDGDVARYFVMPVGGGSRLDSPDGAVIVVTPQSPLVRALQEGRGDFEVVGIV